ncbi:winged helix-turn-helix domain-containing protein [Yersinia ruckeri]|uniref:winged helix-turn-helix domain-containing protein n=1 Tax=Yersinia ruckeri TaxID=29486 RepID=UPI0022381E74|nr:helix-turn-helix domain-containing protein [Yersinia ruckeri]MCW6624896.1 helix-turn-helix domain-containing protein [Yersinia ruckeri]
MELNPVFARRLYLCWLISVSDKPNVPRLMALTGWPRRTLQDVLKALPGLGVTLSFIQDGVRNNDGFYCLESWGALNKKWVLEQHQAILAAIE